MSVTAYVLNEETLKVLLCRILLQISNVYSLNFLFCSDNRLQKVLTNK